MKDYIVKGDFSGKDNIPQGTDLVPKQTKFSKDNYIL